MEHQWIGVVLLVPQPLAAEINGVRRALGDGVLGRIEPHITLVPPVKVAEEEVPQALAIVRAAAAAIAPFTLRIGPVKSFLPHNPVAYLEVGGEPESLEAIGQLRLGCLRGPLERPPEFEEFVPHVTVSEQLTASRTEAAVTAGTDFSLELSFDRVHVLAEDSARVWGPIADAPLGERAIAVARGGLPFDLVTSGRPDIEGAALLASEHRPGRPFAVTAYRDGRATATAWGWSARGGMELADLVVAAEHRDQGVGHQVLAEVIALARRRKCTSVAATAPPDGAAGALLDASGFRMSATRDEDVPGPHRWELEVEAAETEDPPSPQPDLAIRPMSLAEPERQPELEVDS